MSSFESETKKTAFLTFDDGPSENTVKILDILESRGIKATFFVIGRDNHYFHPIYRQIMAQGHKIGNHTYTHEYAAIYSSAASFQRDYQALDELLQSITGVAPEMMRFPGGSNNRSSSKYGGLELMPQLIKAIIKEGRSYVDWNVNWGDAAQYLVPKERIIESVLKGAAIKGQAIILLHDAPAKTTTVAALPEIIDGLIKLGFGFETITKESAPCRFKLLEYPHPLVPPWLAWDVPVGCAAGERSPELLELIINQCNVASGIRYLKNRQSKQETYCNIFVWDVTRALEAEIPHWVKCADGATPSKPDLTYIDAYETTANFLGDWLSGPGLAHGWRPATALEALSYANSGCPAVAVVQNKQGHGHIAMVRPGICHPDKGVPIAQAGEKNFDNGFLADGFGTAISQVIYFVHP